MLLNKRRTQHNRHVGIGTQHNTTQQGPKEAMCVGQSYDMMQLGIEEVGVAVLHSGVHCAANIGERGGDNVLSPHNAPM